MVSPTDKKLIFAGNGWAITFVVIFCSFPPKDIKFKSESSQSSLLNYLPNRMELPVKKVPATAAVIRPTSVAASRALNPRRDRSL